MLGGIVKGIGSSLAGGIADVAGISDFTSALGGEKKPEDKLKAVEPKPFDDEESPTKVLQRILGEVQSIHKVMASQVVPPSEEEEIQRDKDKKDDEVIEAIEDLRPDEEKKKKKKKPWWKMLWDWISPFIKFILKPLSWIKSLLSLPLIIGLGSLLASLTVFFFTNPIGMALLAIGIIAVNWKDIKAAITGYVDTIKGWVKTALNAIGLGWMIKDDPEEESKAMGSDLGDVEGGVLGSAVDELDLDADIETDDTVGEDDQGRASSDYMIEGQLNQLGIPDTPVPEAEVEVDEGISLGATDDMEEERFRRETAMMPDDERFGGGEVPQAPITPTTDERTEKQTQIDDLAVAAVQGKTDTGAMALVDMGGTNIKAGESSATIVPDTPVDEPPKDIDSWGIDWSSTESVRKTMANPMMIRDDQLGEQLTTVAQVLRSEKGIQRDTMLETLQAAYANSLGGLNQWMTPNGIMFTNTTTRVLPGFFTPETEGVMERASKGEQIAVFAMQERQEQRDTIKASETEEDAGKFQVGGVIPKGKSGLAHEGETVRTLGQSNNTMLGEDTRVKGPARVKREAPVMYGSAAHKQMMKDDPTGGATAPQHQRDMDIAGTSGKAGGIDAIARQRIGALDWADEIGSQRVLAKALIDKRNVTKQAQAAFSIDPTHGQSAGRSDLGGLVKVGWDAEQTEKMIKGRSKGRESEYSPKQVTFYLALSQFGKDFTAFKDINNSRIRELGQLQDAAGVDSTKTFKNDPSNNSALTILNSLRQNLSSQDLTEKVEGEMKMMVARMQNLPSINESTLQQAGQQGTVSVVNQTNTTNVSTASSSSNQANVGQTQQSIPISNTHGAAPASV